MLLRQDTSQNNSVEKKKKKEKFRVKAKNCVLGTRTTEFLHAAGFFIAPPCFIVQRARNQQFWRFSKTCHGNTFLLIFNTVCLRSSSIADCFSNAREKFVRRCDPNSSLLTNPYSEKKISTHIFLLLEKVRSKPAPSKALHKSMTSQRRNTKGTLRNCKIIRLSVTRPNIDEGMKFPSVIYVEWARWPLLVGATAHFPRGTFLDVCRACV